MKTKARETALFAGRFVTGIIRSASLIILLFVAAGIAEHWLVRAGAGVVVFITLTLLIARLAQLEAAKDADN